METPEDTWIWWYEDYFFGEASDVRTSDAIAPVDIADAKVAVASQTYTGRALAPAVKVTLDGAELVEGKDFAVAGYANNKNAGKATVRITGKGDYAGAKAVPFTIGKAANNASVKSANVKKKVKYADVKKKACKVDPPKVTAKFGKAVWKAVGKYPKKVLALKSGKVVVKKGAAKGT